ncbi:hypothetical protein HMPREF1548_02410 [Clostridium sp. KLE 1755]|nr:hypothetical protein HMPREF1548_02410 [Clostridium sp. KLE 1755]
MGITQDSSKIRAFLGKYILLRKDTFWINVFLAKNNNKGKW